MQNKIEVSGHPDGAGLNVRTPGQFAMDVAIEVLGMLDARPGFRVKKTGWQNGFGLEVAAWIPIESENVVAELQTDGCEFHIRLASGSRNEFGALFDLVVEYLEASRR